MSSIGFFHEMLPWNFITKFHPGVVIHKDGSLQRTFAFRAPDVDSCADFEINNIALRVNDFAKRLGSGWAVHIEAQRYFSTGYPSAEFAYSPGSFDLLAPYLIDRERGAAFSAAGSHFESSYYITFTRRPPAAAVQKLVSFFIQSASDAGDGANTIRENVEAFVNDTNTVAGLLSQNMLIAPLDNEETVAYLHSAVSMKRCPISFPFTAIFLDRILPDSQLTHSQTMKLDDFFIPIIGVNDFPQETYPAILDRLNRERLEYRWSSRFICIDKEDAKKEIQKKEKAHRGSATTLLQDFARGTDGPPPRAVNHGAAVKEQDAIEAGIEVETDEASLVFLTTCVMVWDTDYIEARKKMETVMKAVNSTGFTCKEETFNALESFKSMMPGNAYSNLRAHPVMSYSLSHVLPLSSVWPGIRSNEHAAKVSGCALPHLTCSTAEGTPFFLNLNIGDVGHTAILGPTGAGKSTLTNTLEAQFLKYPGSKVVVFDKGKSCRGLCLACGGLFFEPASGSSAAGVAFQPLRDLGTDTDLLAAQDFIETCLRVNNFDVSPLMSTAIKQVLEMMKDIPESRRTLTTFQQYAAGCYSELPNFTTMLGKYFIKGGQYGKIFDSRSSGLSLDTRFLAIETEELMKRGDECIVPALVYLFSLVEKMFDGSLTLLVLDEAWLFLKNPLFAEKIAEWLKVLRKKNVFVVFATQEVADVYNSPLRSTITTNCPTMIFLPDKRALTASSSQTYAAFGLSESEITVLASAQGKRDYFYKSELGARLFQLDLGPLTLALVGGPDHKALDAMVAEKGRGVPLCRDILHARYIDYHRYLGPGAPLEPEVKPLGPTQPFLPPLEPAAPPAGQEAGKIPRESVAALIDALAALPKRKPRDGQGRQIEHIAAKFGVSVSAAKRCRMLCRAADTDTLSAVRSGKLSLYAAFKRLPKGNRAKTARADSGTDSNDTNAGIAG